MNILTKICVVLLMLTSLVASVVFIDYTRRTSDFRTYYKNERIARKEWGEQYSELKKQLDRTTARYIDLRESTDDSISTRDDKIELKNDTIQSLKIDIGKKDADNKRMSANLIQLQTQLQGEGEEKDSLNSEVKAKITKIGFYETQVAAKTTEIGKLTEEIKTLKKSLRVSQMQKHNQTALLTAQRKEIERLIPLIPASAKKGDKPVAGPAITGHIRAVSEGIASINVGSANGVKKGMEFVIYRGGKFVGKLKIEEVRADEAGGLIRLGKLKPLPGDRVDNRMDLGSVE